jgi:hypothetical protein
LRSPLPIKSDLLRPLSALNSIQHGAIGYYRELRNSADLFLQVAAWCALLDAKQLTIPDWSALLPLCTHGAVRSRAYAYFHELNERGLARQVAEAAPATHEDLDRRLMLAELDGDNADVADIHGALYLETGDLVQLEKAARSAEVAGGWRPSLLWAVRMLVASPLNPATVQLVYSVLEAASQPDLLQEVAELFAARNMYLQIGQIFLANAALARGDAKLCLERLAPLDDARVIGNKALASYLGAIRALRASAEEKLGHYKRAYDAFVALNEAERAKDIDPQNYTRGIEIRAKIVVPPLPADTFPNMVQMVGFPRSGTTLLENVLAAHPQIETFEEIPALTAAIDRIERVVLGKLPPEPPEATFAAARARYFEEVAALRHKPDASVLVDKMPIRSADAAFITKLFPEWRYVFSIRHPYDVVLSCFKQRFTPNAAMENFRTIDGAARLYDLAMTEWFKQHSMDDPTVHYVRYDDLVTNFEPVTRATLDFLGVEWDDAVKDFSRSAEQRAAKTPSYQKVRQGLSIGVQTQWRNYRFAFESEATKPLAKWAEFFGYETQ